MRLMTRRTGFNLSLGFKKFEVFPTLRDKPADIKKNAGSLRCPAFFVM